MEMAETKPPQLDVRDLTLDTFRTCIDLKVAPGQERFVASNLYSVAESAVRPDTWPLVVYSGDEMVGFVMVSREPETGRFWIMRLMIAATHQGRGLGRATLDATVALIIERHHCQEIYLGVDEDNRVAMHLYKDYGFQPTGEIEDGEVVLRLSIPQRVEERRF